TVNTSGLATGANSGSTVLTSNITASASGQTGSATLTVNPATPVLTTITVAPATATIANNGTQQVTATAKDHNVATMSGITFTCPTRRTSALTVNTSGLATGANTGSTVLTSNITASASGKSGSATLTVNPATPVLTTITVAPATATIANNGTQ